MTILFLLVGAVPQAADILAANQAAPGQQGIVAWADGTQQSGGTTTTRPPVASRTRGRDRSQQRLFFLVVFAAFYYLVMLSPLLC